MKDILVDCPDCEEGKREVQHPNYGSRTCPEPSITIRCATCEGTGKVWEEEE